MSFPTTQQIIDKVNAELNKYTEPNSISPQILGEVIALSVQDLQNQPYVFERLKGVLKQNIVELFSGSLEVGKTYLLRIFEAGDDFSNVGFVDTDTPFVATGTTPNNWSNFSTVYNLTDGAPNVSIFTNTLTGNISIEPKIIDNPSGGEAMSVQIIADQPIFKADKTMISFPFERVDDNTIQLPLQFFSLNIGGNTAQFISFDIEVHP